MRCLRYRNDRLTVLLGTRRCDARSVTPEEHVRRDLLAKIGAVVPLTTGFALVAVDGCDGAGKTWFANELAAVLKVRDRQVIRASVDDFHNPKAVRYRQGVDSADGYWLDAYDYNELRADLLDPLRPGGSGRYRLAAHDRPAINRSRASG